MLGSGRFFSRRVDSIPKLFISRSTARHVKVDSKEEIVIPARIERKPTDILKALASTVDVDHTAFHYKYPDDPYFYPFSVSEKRVYALALESGRNSAKWIIKENPAFFKHQLSEPPIEAFFPKIKDADEVEFTEELLLRTIEERDVLKAIEVYTDLKRNNKDVSKTTKQSLLELACFYNSKERAELDTEGKWFEGFLGLKDSGKDTVKKNWNASGFAQKLFDEMDPDCPLAVSTMIQGLLKYYETASALDLYDSARRKRMKLSVGAYNAVLEETPFIVNDRSKISNFVLGQLKEMAEKRVRPNLGTLNSALRALSSTSDIIVAENIVKDFLRLGIQPSLGSFGYLFLTFARLKIRKGKDETNTLEDMMAYLENKDHEILHPSDLEFFINAMEAFSGGLKDPDLAMRLADMYFKPNNRKFIVQAREEQYFFKKLLVIVFKAKPIDLAMDTYRRNYLTRCSPDTEITSAALEAVHENLSSQYLVEFWRDCKITLYSKNRDVLCQILAMVDCIDGEEANQVFLEAAINYMEKMKDLLAGDQNVTQDILLAFIKNDDQQRIFDVVNIIKNNSVIFSEISKRPMSALLEYAMSKKKVPLILECLMIASDLKLMFTSELAEKALPLLSGDDKTWAQGLVEKEEETEKKNRKQKGGKAENDSENSSEATS